MPQEHYQRVHGFTTIPVIHPALFFDDSSGTFTWQAEGDGADWTAEYDPLAAHVQLNGILLKTRETTPTTNDHVVIYRRLWLPPRGVLRLQYVACLPTTGPNAALDLTLIWNDGVNAHDAGIRLRATSPSIYYIRGWDAPGFDWGSLPTFSRGEIDHSWVKIDLSVNLDTNFHHRVQVNEQVLDGRTLAISTHPPALEKHMHLAFDLSTPTAAQATAYVDQILLTQETP